MAMWFKDLLFQLYLPLKHFTVISKEANPVFYMLWALDRVLTPVLTLGNNML